MKIMLWLLNELLMPIAVGVLFLAYGERLKTTFGVTLAWTKAQRIKLYRRRLSTVEALCNSPGFAIRFFTEALTDTVLQAARIFFWLTLINALEWEPFTKRGWTLKGFISVFGQAWKGQPVTASILAMLVGVYYVHQRANDALNLGETRAKLKKRLHRLGDVTDV